MYKPSETVALPLNVSVDRPLQAQLFEQVRTMILNGHLKAGNALPATRALSEQLGISRNTVVLAYDRLLAEGYIESKRSIGTFVSDAIPNQGAFLKDVPLGDLGEGDFAKSTTDTKTDTSTDVIDAASFHEFDLDLPSPTDSPSPLSQTQVPVKEQARVPVKAQVPKALSANTGELEIDFHPDFVDPDLFPERSWRRIYAQNCGQMERYVNAQDPCGHYELRRAIADHLGPARGIIASPDDVLIVSGALEGRALLSHLLLSPPLLSGDKHQGSYMAVMENPGRKTVAQLFHRLRAEMHFIDVDDQGLRTDLLPTPNEHHLGGLVYVNACRHYPFGMSLSLARRIELLEWSLTNAMTIVEDESDSDFAYNGAPLTALKGLDRHERVIYLGSFEPLMGRAMGLGYLVLPPRLVDAARALKKIHFSGPSILEQATMADYLESGAYDRHLRKSVKKGKEKHDFLIDLLQKHFGDVTLLGAEGGLQLAFVLPEKFGSAAGVAQEMRSRHGVGIYSLSSNEIFLNDKAYEINHNKASQMLIFGYGCLSIQDIHEGVQRLADMLKSQVQTPLVTKAKQKGLPLHQSDVGHKPQSGPFNKNCEKKKRERGNVTGLTKMKTYKLDQKKKDRGVA